MKSNEFLTEEIQVKEMVSKIQQDCQPFLNEANGRLIYRGLGTSTEPFMKKSVRLKDRKPKDVPILLHKTINSFFKKKFGAEFRNAMFCSGDIHFADFYGKIYAIFPIGDFKFVWSTHVDDLFMAWDEYDPSQSADFLQYTDETQTQEIKDSIKMFLKTYKNTYKNNNLEHAIISNNEIMIRCENYYAVKLKIVEDPQYNFMRMLDEK